MADYFGTFPDAETYHLVTGNAAWRGLVDTLRLAALLDGGCAGYGI